MTDSNFVRNEQQSANGFLKDFFVSYTEDTAETVESSTELKKKTMALHCTLWTKRESENVICTKCSNVHLEILHESEKKNSRDDQLKTPLQNSVPLEGKYPEHTVWKV